MVVHAAADANNTDIKSACTASDTDNSTTQTVTIAVTDSMENGNISFTLKADDATGNTTTITQADLTNDVNIIVDNTLPTITSKSLASNNSTNTLAISGNVVTLTFVTSETIQDLASGDVTFNDGTDDIADNRVTYTQNGGDNSLTHTAKFTVAGTDNDGSITATINVAGITDRAGNAIAGANQTKTGVTIDTTAPANSVTVLSILKDDGSSAAKLNDTVTITLTSSEQLQGFDFTFTGQEDVTATEADNGDGTFTYTADHTVTDTSYSGNFSATLTDLGGNTSSITQADVTVAKVSIDATPPSVSSGSIVTNNTGYTSKGYNDIVITVAINFSEVVNKPTILLVDSNDTTSTVITISADNVTNASGNGTDWSGTYTIVDGDGTDGKTLKGKVATYTDSAGNQSTNYVTPTSVQVDKSEVNVTAVAQNYSVGTRLTGEGNQTLNDNDGAAVNFTATEGTTIVAQVLLASDNSVLQTLTPVTSFGSKHVGFGNVTYLLGNNVLQLDGNLANLANNTAHKIKITATNSVGQNDELVVSFTTA